MLFANILETIGNTPIVKLNTRAKHYSSLKKYIPSVSATQAGFF